MGDPVPKQRTASRCSLVVMRGRLSFSAGKKVGAVSRNPKFGMVFGGWLPPVDFAFAPYQRRSGAFKVDNRVSPFFCKGFEIYKIPTYCQVVFFCWVDLESGCHELEFDGLARGDKVSVILVPVFLPGESL